MVFADNLLSVDNLSIFFMLLYYASDIVFVEISLVLDTALHPVVVSAKAHIIEIANIVFFIKNLLINFFEWNTIYS